MLLELISSACTLRCQENKSNTQIVCQYHLTDYAEEEIQSDPLISLRQPCSVLTVVKEFAKRPTNLSLMVPKAVI